MPDRRLPLVLRILVWLTVGHMLALSLLLVVGLFELLSALWRAWDLTCGWSPILRWVNGASFRVIAEGDVQIRPTRTVHPSHDPLI